MNIFKVLSSRKKFPEEQMSVLLGWLMHPTMEHGLGRLFLERFIEKVVGDNNTEIIQKLDAIANDEIIHSLEEYVDDKENRAFIDVVYLIDDYVFAIENKIHDGAFMGGQLKREYKGLLKKYSDKKIVMVYLVPNENPDTRNEYDSLVSIIKKPHMSFFVIWSDIVCKIIDSLISDEKEKTIKPMPIQTRIMLESLHTFILDGFCGYGFLPDRGSSGWAKITEYGDNLTGREILHIISQPNMKNMWIGKQEIESKLSKMSKLEIETEKFYFRDKPSSKASSWITGERLEKIYNDAH